MFITWRLHGSLPANRSFPKTMDAENDFLAMEQTWDNACTGPQFLSRPEIANVVVQAIQFRDARDYELHAYVVMSNHVHLLMTPLVKVSKTMQSLKRFTARECNRILGFTGKQFWQNESYDRLVRDDAEFQSIVRYIENNPVTARLVPAPEKFFWSSAWPIFNRRQVTNLPHKVNLSRHPILVPASTPTDV
jgi:putative transposase